MNKQVKYNKDGSIRTRGIEWTDYTTNPIAGCPHSCRWHMPDGTTAICYAEAVAESIASAHYPNGFAADYWHPGELQGPATIKKSSKFFVGSMSDVFAARVDQKHIDAVFEIARMLPRHRFQFLTKNPKRLLKQKDIPWNCWIGVSSPPDEMWGHELSQRQKDTMMMSALEVLAELHSQGVLTWLSAEPLSWDIRPHFEAHPGLREIDWLVIGAASNERKIFQPVEQHVRNMVEWADAWEVPVFYKGNLRDTPFAAADWREEFPIT
jgi:protein gp37